MEVSLASQIIPALVNGVRRGDSDAVADALEVLQQTLQDMRDTLKLLHGKPAGQPLHGTSTRLPHLPTLTLSIALLTQCMWSRPSSTAS